jgi:DNA-binding CsgD family transcriptional regulator
MGLRFGAVPVVLGETDGGAVDVCWVIADSGTILVSFNDEQTAKQRLEVAAFIYGITPAQLKVAGLIVGGHDLVSAAGKLGVRVTTVRTHLLRMYDKIGVRSQPALVRALLSVGSPLG